MATDMKTIKIPENEFARVRKARELLVLNGINNLDEHVRKIVKEEIKDFEKLTMGIIIGIGATILIQELSK